MRKCWMGLVSGMMLCALDGTANAQGTVEVYGAYSYFRPAITSEQGFTCPPGVLCIPGPVSPPTFVSSRQNLNGWQVGGGIHVLPFLRVVGDFSGYYGPTTSNSTSRTHQYMYLAGPEVSLPTRVSPFAHVLVGGTRQMIGFGTFPLDPAGHNSVIPTDNSGFTSAIGGGIDLKVEPLLWIRPVQFDYVMTRLGGNTQNQARVSAGIVFRF